MSARSLLNAIDQQHLFLNETFLLHQEALILCRPELSLSIFKEYMAFQISHLTFENDFLLPELSKIKDARWPHTLYKHEHNKVEQMLSKNLKNITEGCRYLEHEGASSTSTYRRWLIELLEKQKSLKNVLEHHEAREEQGMLMELDNNLAPEAIHELCNELDQQSKSVIESIDTLRPQWLQILETQETK